MCRATSPAIGDKRVPDQAPDACFHDRMLHRPHARFAKPPPPRVARPALVMSPKRSDDPGPLGPSLVNQSSDDVDAGTATIALLKPT